MFGFIQISITSIYGFSLDVVDLDPNMEGHLKARLFDIAFNSGWMLARAGNFIDFHGQKWDKDHPWNADGCLHKPEAAVLTLHALEQEIEKYKEKFLGLAEIVDGNWLYKVKFKIKHWQYEPSSPWIVTPETFNSL